MNYLVGNNIKLVKFTERHITSSYIEWLNDHSINRYMFSGRLPIGIDEISIPNTISELRFAALSSLKYSCEDDTLVESDDYSEYIGTISINSIDWISRRAEIGYMIGDKNYWGVGIASEMVKLITDYGIDRINMNKIEAGVISGNIGSIKVLEKNGFRKYGTIPSEYFLEGEYLDSDRFYLLQKWREGAK